MPVIPINGFDVIVDECDVALVMSRTWSILKRPHTNYLYATTIPQVILHRVIMGAKKGEFVDHINHNGLDCRRSNMRIATATQNQGNRRKPKGTASNYKGIYRDNKKWAAQVCFMGKKRCLGTFLTQEEAARAYDVAARELFGEFALTNFNE